LLRPTCSLLCWPAWSHSWPAIATAGCRSSWPLYLLFGVAGGSDYGAPTSHFWLGAPFRNGQRPLFPDSFRGSMQRSNLGVLAMLVLLGLAALQWSPARVLCVYGLPDLVINAEKPAA
jgi:hypothetical protein